MTTANPNNWPRQIDVRNYYGNPDANGDGMPDLRWEMEELVKVGPPYRMLFSWEPYAPVKVLRVHKRVAPSLSRILRAIADHYGDQAAIEKACMHLCGGAYNFRTMRSNPRALSMHSFGCAIDLDPEHNPMGRPWMAGKAMIDMAVVAIFEAEGWTWGGRWTGTAPDCMHFQATHEG